MERIFLQQKDLYEILPLSEDKVKKLLISGCIPTVRIGRDYLTTVAIVEQWVQDHLGKEIPLA